MKRLVIRIEGSPPDIRVIVKCGGPGLRTRYVTGRPTPEKTVKEVIKAAVAEVEALVESQRG